MEYCRYHPITPASYHCQQCHLYCCDNCVDEGSQFGHGCFHCKKSVNSLGDRFNATPFWRRLQESFRYPVHRYALSIIFMIAGLTIFTLNYLPLPLLFLFLTYSLFLQYCFSCLESTAEGSTTPPDVTVIYENSILVGFQVGAIIIGSVWGIHKYIHSPGLALFAITVLTVLLPAILINLSLTGSFLQAINPLNSITLILRIGLPYGLLLALIAVMNGSAFVIYEIIFKIGGISTLSFMGLFAVTNYYLIVIFQIMGYMIFQYQGRLGFSARLATEDSRFSRTDIEKELAAIKISIKEGDFDDAAHQYAQLVKTYKNNSQIYRQCFDFLLAIKNEFYLKEFSPVYFNFLNSQNQELEAIISYKKILAAFPNYMPKLASDRLMLATICQHRGDHKLAVKLINGIHKDHPKYEKLSEAYEVMAEALKDLNMAAKAQKALALAAQLKKQQEQQKNQPKSNDGGLSLVDH